MCGEKIICDQIQRFLNFIGVQATQKDLVTRDRVFWERIAPAVREFFKKILREKNFLFSAIDTLGCHLYSSVQTLSLLLKGCK
jgi:hypothetical protein